MATASVYGVIDRLPNGNSFDVIASAVRGFRWRPEVQANPIHSPQRIAPYAVALEAEIHSPGEDDATASGRLVILHNPAGEEAWEGNTRVVSYTQADVEFEMANDPLLPDVAWSWLMDALDNAGAGYTTASGTVTTMTSRSFGGLDAKPDRAEVEVRCSWTMADEAGTAAHVGAWQDLLCQLAGLEPLSDSVIALGHRAKGWR